MKDKICPKCGSILQRIYARVTVDEKQKYEPIGFMCPMCCEDMIVLDCGWRKNDEGIRCSECGSKMVAFVKGSDDKLKCLRCKCIFDLNSGAK
jgi:predicted RNA-binding Zn-ribbon protein involved in translation (DUF1610 family)